MLFVLLGLNLALLVVAVLYGLRILPGRSRRWSPVMAVSLLAATVVSSLFSYRYAQLWAVDRAYQRHYWAGLDELQRGNLEEAERHFEAAKELRPDKSDPEKQLQELRERRPAEKREQRGETRVNAVPSSQSPGKEPTRPPVKRRKPFQAMAHQPSPFEIRHYDLEARIDPDAHTLEATATVRVASRGERLSRLDFSLHPEFSVVSTQVDGRLVKHTHTNDLLTLSLRDHLAPDRDAVVTVRYRREGKAVVADGAGLIDPRGVYFISEARWYPGTGELDFRAPVRVRATVPKGYTVVSVGKLNGVRHEEKQSTYDWETKELAAMVSLAAGKYHRHVVSPASGQASGTGGGPEVSCYVFAEHRSRAAAFAEEAAAISRYYERLFGSYPYEKLAVVEIPQFPGGYGTTSFVMLIDRSFGQKQVPREFLAHEIAHQWWGNMIFPQGLGAAWLSEAFANYGAWMYEEAKLGNRRVLQKRVAQATQKYFAAIANEGDQPIAEIDPYQPPKASEAIIYEKGAVVLHMLRAHLGDARFKRVLRRFADEYRFKKAKIADFRRVAQQESGEDLNWFFSQWLERPGGMQLEYRFRTEPGGGKQNRAILTVTQANKPYRAKLKAVLDVENQVESHELQVQSPREIFEFTVPGKLTNVLLDADNTYLMRPPRWVVDERGGN